MIAIVNSTPLITLSLTNRLSLLESIFDQVYVPQSVYDEVVTAGKSRPGAEEVAQASWLKIQEPQQKFPIPIELLGLDVGERDVILIAQEVKADWVLLDEQLGRKVATVMGFQVKGTLGILLIAYQTGLLSNAEALDVIQQLDRSSIRLSPKLIKWFEAQLL